MWEDRGKETGFGISVRETPRGKFLKCDEREKGRERTKTEIHRELESDTDQESMHSSQIFMCWVTF